MANKAIIRRNRINEKDFTHQVHQQPASILFAAVQMINPYHWDIGFVKRSIHEHQCTHQEGKSEESDDLRISLQLTDVPTIENVTEGCNICTGSPRPVVVTLAFDIPEARR